MARPLAVAIVVALLSFNAFAASELEPIVLAPTGGNVSDTASAFAGGKYLTVWRQLFMPDTGVWGAFSDANGRPFGPAFPVIASTNALNLRLFADGDSFVLFWNEAYQNTRMCRVDNAGHATTPIVIDPKGYDRVDAFVDGRAMAISSTVDRNEALIFDDSGALVRSGISAVGPASQKWAFPANHSFLLAQSAANLTVTRYSTDGQALQTFTLPQTQCTITPCWIARGIQQLANGTLLLLLQTGPNLTTMTIAPDGTRSQPHPVPVSFPQIGSAALHRCGSQMWVVDTGGQKSEGPYDVEARAVDEQGLPLGDPLVVIRGLDFYESVTFAEGPGALLIATSPRTAGPQIETYLFRDLQPVEAQIVSITPTIQQNAQVASNGTNFLAAWRDTDGIGYPEVHWAILDATGERKSAVFSGNRDMVGHSLVSNGFDYLMIVSGLVARRIAPDGTLLGETPLGASTNNWSGGVGVVSTGTGYLVVWSTGDAVWETAITPAGIANVPQQILQVAPSVPFGLFNTYEHPALAWDGRRAFLVISRVERQDYTPTPMMPVVTKATLEGYSLGADGSLLAGSLVLASRKAEFSQPVVASSGNEFFVATSDQRFVVKSGVVTPIDTQFNVPTDLIWDGTAFVLARDSSIVERIARDGSSLGAAYRKSLRDNLDVAVDSAGHLVIVGAQADEAGPLRAFSYVPADLSPLQQGRRRVITR